MALSADQSASGLGYHDRIVECHRGSYRYRRAAESSGSSGPARAWNDFISEPGRANDGDGIDPDPNDSGDQDRPGGAASFHGTHVAGTVAAASNNQTGVAGVAWNARIMPLRVLGVRGGADNDIIQAIRYAAGLSNDSNTVPAQKADIINLSLAGPVANQATQAAVNAARAENVIIIASAGNNADPRPNRNPYRGFPVNVPSFPAAFDGVVSVGAVDINRSRSVYSHFSSAVDIAAPGGDREKDLNGDGFADAVYSTVGFGSGSNPRHGYIYLDGTSMACPHVAGVAALMKTLNPGLTPAQFDSLLASGALTSDLGAPGRDDEYGHGLVDAQKAVVAAGSPPGPTLSVTPSTLNLGSDLSSATLTVSNIGSGALTVSSATSSEPWLTVSQPVGDGLGDYTITVDRSGLINAPYAGTITFDSDANDITVSVTMQVGAIVSTGDAGFHFVLLVDAATNQAVAQQAVGASGGVYNFSFTGVTSGSYQIFVGADSNNDDFICDPGEACGIYISVDEPTIVDVNSDVSGLDFTTGFDSSIISQSVRGGPGLGLERRLLNPKAKSKHVAD